MAEFTSLNGYAVKDSVARSIAKGRNQAVAFVDYATMIEALNEYEKDEFKAGQNIYIGVVGVPDLWVYSVEDIRHTYIYESDEDVVEKLTTNTTIQAGFFKLAMLEGQKGDLTTYDQHLAKHDEDIEKNATDISKLNSSLEDMKVSFQDGCNTIYNAVVAKGVTPLSKSPEDIATAINNMQLDIKHSVTAQIATAPEGSNVKRHLLSLISDGKTVKSAYYYISADHINGSVSATI